MKNEGPGCKKSQRWRRVGGMTKHGGEAGSITCRELGGEAIAECRAKPHRKCLNLPFFRGGGRRGGGPHMVTHVKGLCVANSGAIRMKTLRNERFWLVATFHFHLVYSRNHRLQGSKTENMPGRFTRLYARLMMQS